VETQTTSVGASRDYERIARAIRYLDERRGQRCALADVASHLDLSPFHFQRMFTRWAGVSPKRFLQAMSAAAALERLRDARTVLDATYDIGLSSPGRLHDLLVTVEALTPGEARRLGAGLEIRHAVHETSFGAAHVAETDRGVCHVAFVDGPGGLERSTDALARVWPGARIVRDAAAGAAAAARMRPDACAAHRPLALLVAGTNLQVQVWRALLRVPAGTVVSYGGLARALKRPRAARAVAGAVGANRIAWWIPCHRVLRASGALGGYRWDPGRKRALLAGEAGAVRSRHSGL
jgi:AraC family transcriptional regulator of adaptative response/methylated-DNA-[protein]-cysteine methyltransferase